MYAGTYNNIQDVNYTIITTIEYLTTGADGKSKLMVAGFSVIRLVFTACPSTAI